MSLLLFKAEKVALSLGPTCNFTHLILGHNECSWIEYFDILIMRNCRITVHSYFKHFFLLPFYVKQQNNTTGYRYYLIDTGFFVCFLFFLFFFFKSLAFPGKHSSRKCSQHRPCATCILIINRLQLLTVYSLAWAPAP